MLLLYTCFIVFYFQNVKSMKIFLYFYKIFVVLQAEIIVY